MFKNRQNCQNFAQFSTDDGVIHKLYRLRNRNFASLPIQNSSDFLEQPQGVQIALSLTNLPRATVISAEGIARQDRPGFRLFADG
jgi:hypothetical protein